MEEKPFDAKASGRRSTRSAVGICSLSVPRRTRRPRPTRANSSTNDLPRHERRHRSHQSAQHDGSRPILGPSSDARGDHSARQLIVRAGIRTCRKRPPSRIWPATRAILRSRRVRCGLLRRGRRTCRGNPRSSRGARNADQRLRHPHRGPGAPWRRDARHLKHARIRPRARATGRGLGGVAAIADSPPGGPSGDRPPIISMRMHNTTPRGNERRGEAGRRGARVVRRPVAEAAGTALDRAKLLEELTRALVA
jgi:hypothetical protein